MQKQQHRAVRQASGQDVGGAAARVDGMGGIGYSHALDRPTVPVIERSATGLCPTVVGGGHCRNDHISTSNGFGFIVLWSISVVIGEKTGEPGGPEWITGANR